MEDEQIIRFYFDRRELAIVHTKEKYGSAIRSIARQITGDPETAEECENDTYLAAWNRIPPDDPQAYFFAYLARITRHIAIDRCRKEHRLKRQAPLTAFSEELAEILPSGDTVEEAFEANVLADTVNAFLKTLPEKKRILFVRRYFYLDSISALSARMKMSESQVKTALFRIRQSLRKALKKEGFLQ